MASSPSSVLMLGMGPTTSGLFITLGFGTGGTAPVSGDHHDGGRKPRWRIDEIGEDREIERRQQLREDREKLTTDLRLAVVRITGKPAPLDASPKALASIARRSEGIDYQAVIREIERLAVEETAIAALATERAAYEAYTQRAVLEQERALSHARRLRKQEEEALMLLLLH